MSGTLGQRDSPQGGDPATNPTGLTLDSPLLLLNTQPLPPHPQYTPESTHPLSRAEVGIPDRDLGQPETSTLHSLHALQMRPKLPLQAPAPRTAAGESPGPSRTASSAPCPGRHTLTLISSLAHAVPTPPTHRRSHLTSHLTPRSCASSPHGPGPTLAHICTASSPAPPVLEDKPSPH